MRETRALLPLAALVAVPADLGAHFQGGCEGRPPCCSDHGQTW